MILICNYLDTYDLKVGASYLVINSILRDHMLDKDLFGFNGPFVLSFLHQQLHILIYYIRIPSIIVSLKDFFEQSLIDV